MGTVVIKDSDLRSYTQVKEEFCIEFVQDHFKVSRKEAWQAIQQGIQNGYIRRGAKWWFTYIGD